MKKEYKKPVIEIMVTLCVSQPLMHSDDYIGAKEQTFENEETFFNRDTKSIWDTEEEEE